MAIHVSASTSGRVDRRLDRRDNILTGLSRWLESARRSFEVDALALADADGCLVVGAGSAQRCEELAALAPLFANAICAEDLQVLPLSSGAAWLCAPDSKLSPNDWLAVGDGCLRILGWQDRN